MADVNASTGHLAGAAAIAGLVLALFSAPATLAEEQLATSYYLTVRLVESHLPTEAMARGGPLEGVFTGSHTTATMQIEFDVDASKPYQSTTVADVLERREGSWVGRLFGGRRGIIDHSLKDYEIASNRRLYLNDLVTLGVTYSATHQSMDTIRLFFDGVKDESFKIAPFTYSGLASNALRVFTRSRSNNKRVSQAMRRKAFDIQELAQENDCVIFELRNASERRSPIPWVPCGEQPDSRSPYVKLHIGVSHSRFDVGHETDLKSNLNAYIEKYLEDWRERFERPVDKDVLNRDCPDLIRELDLDLRPHDRNLVLLALLNIMNFDPHAERPITCWERQRADLKSLSEKHESLTLGECARNDAERRAECEFVNDFMLRWRDIGTYEGGDLSWEVRRRGRSQKGDSSLEDFRAQYELDLRYGDLKHTQGEWTGAGSVRDRTGSEECLFGAGIRISVNSVDDGEDRRVFVVHKVVVEADPEAEVRESSVRESRNWRNTAECEVGA